MTNPPESPPQPEGRHVLQDYMPAHPPQATPRRTGAIVGALLAGAIGGSAITAAAFLTFSSDSPSAAAKPAALQDVVTSCSAQGGGVEVADSGRTLLIHVAGQEDRSGTTSSILSCLLGRLETPAAVRAQMEQTRALDGRQNATWPGFTASWTYHPDSGMRLTIQAA